MGRKIYSNKLEQAIVSQIPREILEALSSKGWNVFGIYELVQEEIKREKEEKDWDCPSCFGPKMSRWNDDPF